MGLSNAIERLVEAARAVAHGWMPAQADVLEYVEDRLSDGEYDSSREELLEDVKTDGALFLSCLRELGSTHPSAGESFKFDGFSLTSSDNPQFTPTELFDTASLEQMKNIVGNTRRLCARHSLSGINDYQATRLEETVVSTVTAEALAFAIGIDPNLAYTSSLLRHLGPALAAWNYPDQYTAAMSTLENHHDLDNKLTGLLGFSPNALGALMVRDWHLADEIIHSVAHRSENNLTQTQPDFLVNDGVEALEKLIKVCEAGETLGKIVHAQHYPGATDCWDPLQDLFIEHLGEAGLELVLEEAREKLVRCSPYSVTLPLPPILKKLREKFDAIERNVKMMRKNEYLRMLPTDARSRIELLYRQLPPNQPFNGSLVNFLSEVIPLAGFKCGCIYLHDEQNDTLVPKALIGNFENRKTPLPIKLSSQLARFELPASSLSLKSQVHKELKTRDDKEFTGIAATFRHNEKSVVFYLETQENFEQNISSDPVPVFRALFRCFTDCVEVTG